MMEVHPATIDDRYERLWNASRAENRFPAVIAVVTVVILALAVAVFAGKAKSVLDERAAKAFVAAGYDCDNEEENNGLLKR